MSADNHTLTQIDGRDVRYDGLRDIISIGNRMLSNNRIYVRTDTNAVADTCLEVTTECTLNCLNCFSASSPDGPGLELDCDYIRRMIRERYGSRIRICITGGEPFTHSGIDEILRLPHQFPRLNFVISTNGINILAKHIRLLQKHNWLVALSMHGAKSSHDRYTRSICYDKVLRTLIKLANRTRIHIYATLHMYTTQKDVDHLFSVRDEYQVNFLRFSLPRKFGRYDCRYDRNLVAYIIGRGDYKSGLKMEASNTEFITVKRNVRMSS